MVTCLNDILIPYFKREFVLTFFESSLVQFAFFIAYTIGSLVYFLLSSFIGDPIVKLGYRKALVGGLLTASIACLLFVPAAILHSFPFFLIALFILALGFTILQIAANPYILALGNPETAANRLNLAGALNSLGTTLAPIIGGIVLLGSVTGIDGVKMPYVVLASIFAFLALIFSLVPLPQTHSAEKMETGIGSLRYPQLTLGIIGIFCYVGAEVSCGSFLSAFSSLPETAKLLPEYTAGAVALYWGSLMIGRFTGSLKMLPVGKTGMIILRILVPFIVLSLLALVFYIRGIMLPDLKLFVVFVFVSAIIFWLSKDKPAFTIILFSIVSVLHLIMAMTLHGPIAMWALVSVGLYNSVLWPCIFDLAIKGLGKHTSQGSSLLIMGILGGALVPVIQAKMADSPQIRLQLSFIVPLLCYVYLCFYGWRVRPILAAQGIDIEKDNIS